MNLLSFFKGSKKRSVEPTYGGTWITTGGGADGINERNLLQANKEWVYIAVDKVATAAASVRIKVMKYTKTDDDQEVFEGPLVKFLDNPGPGFTGADFVYLNTVYKQLTGNAFWERMSVRSNQVTPINPTLVEPNISGGQLIGYKVSDGAKQRTLTLDQVLHDRAIDPARPYWGIGKLQKIAGWVDTSTFANELLKSFFLNGAVFGGFITTEEETEERIKLIKMGLVNDHTGVSNAHKMGVLPKGADYKPTMLKMSDMEMGATDDRYRDKILAAFGVPKNLLGVTAGENRATVEGTEYTFAKYTIKPVMDDLMQFLNTNVAAVLDPSGQYYFEYEDFIPDNMEIKLKELELSLNHQPYKTINEVRAESGLPPVTGGDIIYTTMGQVPLGTPEAPADPAPQEGQDTPQPKQPAKTVKRTVATRIRTIERQERVKEQFADDISKAFSDFVQNAQEAKDAADHKAFVGRVDSYAAKIELAVREYNKRQLHDLMGKLGRITKAIAKTDLWNQDEEVKAMVDVVTPLLGGLLTEQAIAEFIDQGFAGKFDSGDLLVKKTIELAAKRLAKSYNETTANLLTSKLNEGIQAGDSLQQLTKRVNEVYAYSDAVRAKAVAQTESVYIANKANLEAYRQSGVVSTLRWYTAEDEMVCPYCEPMNARVVGINETFFKKGTIMRGNDGTDLKLDYRAIDVPPLHTNCRCFVRPDTIAVGE